MTRRRPQKTTSTKSLAEPKNDLLSHVAPRGVDLVAAWIANQTLAARAWRKTLYRQIGRDEGRPQRIARWVTSFVPEAADQFGLMNAEESVQGSNAKPENSTMFDLRNDQEASRENQGDYVCHF
jgi:hypothetical protein